MKKITLLVLLLFGAFWSGRAQCIRDDQYPLDVITAQNTGLYEVISGCNFTQEYAAVNGIAVGADYLFLCTGESGDGYITVTDWDDVVIASGPAPLFVEDITSSQIRLHYSDNADCDGVSDCHDTGFQALLTCPIPLNIGVTGLTTTTASFSWEPGGEETAWQVLVLAEGVDSPGPGDNGTDVTTNSYTATDLNPGTPYNIYVRANCGSEFSPWAPAMSFDTACLPVATFFENFDDSNELPICWSVLRRGNLLFDSVQITDWTTVHSDPNFIEINVGESSGDFDMILVSPNVSTLSTGTHRLKFWARGTAPLEIGTIDSSAETAIFTLIESIDLTNQPQGYAVDFTSYTGPDTYVAIRVAATSIYQYALLDDIRWEVNPTCPDVTEIALTAVSDTSASFSWSPGGTETSWQVAYAPDPIEDPATATIAAVTPNPATTLSGLAPNTAYTYWIRSVCAGNDYGAWIGPYHFTTSCTAISTFFENFDSTEEGTLPTCWSSILSGPSVADFAQVQTVTWGDVNASPNSIGMSSGFTNLNENLIALVSPRLSNVGAGTHRLKFWARGFGADVEIGTVDGPFPGAAFTPLETVALETIASEYTIDFASYTGPDAYIAFRMTGESFSDVYIDDVRWELTPSCPDVMDVTTTAVTPEGGSFTWTSAGDESQWQIAVTDANVFDPSGATPQTVNATEATLNGLSTNTTYNVWVRSLCAGNDYGAWIGPLAFRTDCEAATEFFETFDGVEMPVLPDCWTSIVRGPSNAGFVQTVSWGPVFSSPNAVMLSNADADTDFNDIILVSPNLSTVGTGTHRLKFMGFADLDMSVQVGTLDYSTNQAVFTPLDEIALNDEWEQHTVDFTVYTGTDHYVGIRLVASDIWSSAFLDDIRWEVAPACPDVSDILIEGQTTNTAEMMWGSNGSEASWEVVWSTDPNADPATLPNALTPTETAVTLTGLDDSTTYYVWIRSVCSGGAFGAWIEPESFDTLCEPAAFASLETESFETAEEEDLPICWTTEALSGSET
ncbi:MAG TPA: fibronectin type III domain-containing protein, partial [Flavobacterium sp.]|nr:fibronectin type III domain-containing protein [Flavobacterium sp.]